MAKMGWPGLAWLGGSSHSPEGQADRGQEGPHLLWALQRAQDVGLLRLSCRTSRTPPAEGRKGIRKAPSSQKAPAREQGPSPFLL